MPCPSKTAWMPLRLILKAESSLTNQAGRTRHHASCHSGTDCLRSGAQRKKGGREGAEFTLKDPDSHVVSSAELLAKGPLVVSFYRGIWCPYCNLELQALQAASPEIEKRGASVIAISPQTALNSRKSQRDNKLTFPILGDKKSRIAAAFGLRFRCRTTSSNSTGL